MPEPTETNPIKKQINDAQATNVEGPIPCNYPCNENGNTIMPNGEVSSNTPNTLNTPKVETNSVDKE
jgi:hypothetical protein